jgi:hypothetical protein
VKKTVHSASTCRLLSAWQVAQVRARLVHIQARNTCFSGANLGFAIFRKRPPQMS